MAAFSPDGKRILSVGVDGMLKLWDSSSGKELASVVVSQPQSVISAAFLPSGAQIVVGDQGGNIRLLDGLTGKQEKNLCSHPSLNMLVVAPDGKRLITAGTDRTVRVWEIETGRELRCFHVYSKTVNAIAISPDGRIIATGGDDKLVRLWAMP